MLFRHARWIALACLGALACAGVEEGLAGNTEMNVIVPNGAPSLGGGSSAPGLIDIQTVEYTINCLGNSDTFLDNHLSFPDEVQINGNLEVVDGRTDPQGRIPPELGTPRPGDGAEIWQGFMDLPPGPCTVQLRARDGDGEVICTATEPFNITADTITKVNLVLICDISFQAPVGMLDVDGTFSFNVGNFCPDLFVLNCPEKNPARATCEVRFRDGDSSCGAGCDPQSCVTTPEGLSCTPGPDPGISTTVTCTNLRIDCDGRPNTTETSCTFSGDTLGTVGGSGEGAFDVSCIPPGLGGIPGVVGTCTAITTDGDEDCNKSKTFAIRCPGPNACAELTQVVVTPLQAVIGNSINLSATASDVQGDPITYLWSGTGGVFADPTAASTTYTCAEVGPHDIQIAVSDDNFTSCVAEFTVTITCLAQCTTDVECDDGSDCTVNTCNTGAGLCETANVSAGTSCNGDTGLCDGAGVCVDNCTGVDCSDGNECTDDVCTSVGGAVCSNPSLPSGTSCAGGIGVCNAAGTCVSIEPPVQTAALMVGCRGNVTSDVSILPFDLTVTPGLITANAPFTASLDGVASFSEAFLDAAQAVVPGGVRRGQLITTNGGGLAATVAVSGAATGADVQLGPDPASLQQRCALTGLPCTGAPNLGTCTSIPVVNNNCTTGFVDIPIINGTPLSAGGCTPPAAGSPPPDCDCSPCTAIDPAPLTTKTDQCLANGFCVNGDLPLPLQAATGTYTAGATSGSLMYFDWVQPYGIDVDGTILLPAATFADPPAPVGVRVSAGGLFVALQCAGGVDSGGPDGVGVPDDVSPTPNANKITFLVP